MSMISTKFFVYIVAAMMLPAQAVFAQTDTADQDGDGLTDFQETTLYFTDPLNPDTDSDGKSDWHEIQNGFSPLSAARKKLSETDTDLDKLNDELEIALGTSLKNPDTDGDGKKDGDEVLKGFNPFVGDGNRVILRHVEVDLTTQQLYYFMNNVKIGSMPVSSGKLSTPTPLGEFEIMRKVPVVHYKGVDYDLPNTKWNLEFKRTYYLHGAYWHNQFGIRPMSHGCVNIAYKDVEKLYTFLDVGDKVKIVGKTPSYVKKVAAKAKN